MIRVLIADDHPVVREGIKQIVTAAAGMEVTGEAATGNEALSMTLSGAADVLLLDVTMPGLPFLEVIDQLKRSTATRVLVLSVHPEEHFAIRALKAGAAGYLTKDRSPDELERAIRRVDDGRIYVSVSLAERLAVNLASDGGGAPETLLSDREFQVLRLLGAGRSVTEAAADLGLSPKTVSTYRTRILEKLKLHNTAQLVRFAVEHALSD